MVGPWCLGIWIQNRATWFTLSPPHPTPASMNLAAWLTHAPWKSARPRWSGMTEPGTPSHRPILILIAFREGGTVRNCIISAIPATHLWLTTHRINHSPWATEQEPPSRAPLLSPDGIRRPLDVHCTLLHCQAPQESSLAAGHVFQIPNPEQAGALAKGRHPTSALLKAIMYLRSLCSRTM